MSGIDESEPSTRVPLCQVYVGVCGYILSREALGGATSQGLGYGACPVLESPRARLLGVCVGGGG
jgi:hypothetical protein